MMMKSPSERAEIEAVARALLHKGIGSWDEQSELQRSYLLKQAEKAIEALDRVRDARGDDEGPKVTVEPGRRPFDPAKAARSPQGEIVPPSRDGTTMFLDGTGVTPGSEKCQCTAECEFPCWQRIGIAPACSACKCPPLEELDV